MSTFSDSTPKRVPPPCWTQQETLSLVKAYRDKWYSVNRGNLRAADWDAVATAVPPKTSLQCRHKIEKLRKRYRAEKQKCLRYPGRFYSSWDLFPLLDSMEIGSMGSKLEQETDQSNDIGDGFLLKTFGDRYMVTSQTNGDFDPDGDIDLDPDFAFRARKYSKIDAGFNGDLGTGFEAKFVDDKNLVSVAFRPKDCGGLDGKSEANVGDYGGGFGYKVEKQQRDRNPVPRGVRLPGHSMIHGHYSPYNMSVGEAVDAYEGFPLKSLGDRNLVSSMFIPKNCKKMGRKATPNCCDDDDDDDEVDYRSGTRGGFAKKFVDGWGSTIPGFRPKNCVNIDGNSRSDARSMVSHGSMNVETKGVTDGVGQKEDPVSLLVSAIEQWTEGFMKVEMMKMEMAMEIEKMRMEMELKHNKLILESQRQILNAFGKALLEKNKKKKRVEVLSPNSNRNGYSQVVAAADCESIDKRRIEKEGEGFFT